MQLVEKSLKLLERKTFQFGQGYMEYGFLSAGYGIALSKTTNRSIATIQQETLERFVKLFEKIINSQSEAFQPFLISDGLQKVRHIL